MKALADRSCRHTPEGTPALAGDELAALLEELGHGWAVDGKRLTKTFTFDDFASALAFVDRVGAMADAEDHHPDIHLSWGRATIEIWTHTIDGLAESDFIFAAKAESLRDG